LRSLDLNTCQLGPRGAKALADCPRMESLVNLDLLDNYIGDEGMAALAASPYLTALRNLRIDLNNMGPAGVEALAASVSLGGLEELFLGEFWQHKIGDAAGVALGRSPYLTHLRELRIHDWMEALGAAGLAQAPNLAGLTYLDLCCASGPDAAQALAASPYLRQLKGLKLYGCQIGDEGAKALARSPVLATLEDLDLTYNDLTDEGAQALAASPYLERLNQGGLAMERGNRLTANGMQALRARFGDKVSAGTSIEAIEHTGDNQF
jgi:Ran GTPase-activating protein (RanGAP) involved in mRNA processing and transport